MSQQDKMAPIAEEGVGGSTSSIDPALSRKSFFQDVSRKSPDIKRRQTIAHDNRPGDLKERLGKSTKSRRQTISSERELSSPEDRRQLFAANALSSDSDTDLELEEEKNEFDATGRTMYLLVCKKLGVVPASYFVRHMEDEVLNMGHHGLGSVGVKAVALTLQNNTKVIDLQLQDNWLEGDGGEHIARTLCENCYISKLNIADNKMGTQGLAAICKMLMSNTTLKDLNMSGNEFSDNDSKLLAEALCENNTLKSLNISHNSFAEKAGKIIGDSLKENDTVEDLDLSWNNFRLKAGIDICLAIAANARLQNVNLAMNGLGNEGAFAVAEMIRQNQTITDLDVSHNRIGTPGATVIAKAIESNELMKVFRISNNPIGVEGAKAMLQGATSGVSTLEDLDMSGIEVDKEFVTSRKAIEEARTIKIKTGVTLSDYVIKGKLKKKASSLFGTRVEELSPETLLSVLRAYCDVNGINLYDVLESLDENQDGRLAPGDFKKGLHNAGIETTLSQTDVLEKMLMEIKMADEEIDFTALR